MCWGYTWSGAFDFQSNYIIGAYGYTKRHRCFPIGRADRDALGYAIGVALVTSLDDKEGISLGLTLGVALGTSLGDVDGVELGLGHG